MAAAEGGWRVGGCVEGSWRVDGCDGGKVGMVVVEGRWRVGGCGGGKVEGGWLWWREGGGWIAVWREGGGKVEGGWLWWREVEGGGCGGGRVDGCGGGRMELWRWMGVAMGKGVVVVEEGWLW